MDVVLAQAIFRKVCASRNSNVRHNSVPFLSCQYYIQGAKIDRARERERRRGRERTKQHNRGTKAGAKIRTQSPPAVSTWVGQWRRWGEGGSAKRCYRSAYLPCLFEVEGKRREEE